MEKLTLEELRKELEKAKMTHNQVGRLVAGAKLKCDRMEAEYELVSGEFEDKIEDGEMLPEEEKECQKRYDQATDAMAAATANLRQKQEPSQKARKRVLELRRLMKEKTAGAAVPRTSPGAPAVGLQPGDAETAPSASELFRLAQALSSGESKPRLAEVSVSLGESEPVKGGEGFPAVAEPNLQLRRLCTSDSTAVQLLVLGSDVRPPYLKRIHSPPCVYSHAYTAVATMRALF